MTKLCVKSKVASDIIYVFNLLPKLSVKERYFLLQEIGHTKILKQLFMFIFNRKIIRHVDFTKTKTKNALINADERLKTFITLHEDFYNKKLSVQTFYKKINKLFLTLNLKELQFYKKLTSGSLCNLDYKEISKTFFSDEKLLKTYARFCRGHTFQNNWEIQFPVYIQPLIPGLQIKVIATPDKVMVFSRNQENLSGKIKGLEKAVKTYLTQRNFSKVEVDVMVYSPNYDRISLNSLYKSDNFKKLQYVIYDVIVNSNKKKEILKRRLARVTSITNLLGKKHNYSAMPYFLVKNENKLKKAIKAFNTKPYIKGTIIKGKYSIYEKSRTESWIKIYKEGEYEHFCLKQITFKLNSFSQKEEPSKLIGENSNGIQYIINIREVHRKFIEEQQDNLHGAYFTCKVIDDELYLDVFNPTRNRF